jgi:hypothetical protein
MDISKRYDEQETTYNRRFTCKWHKRTINGQTYKFYATLSTEVNRYYVYKVIEGFLYITHRWECVTNRGH